MIFNNPCNLDENIVEPDSVDDMIVYAVAINLHESVTFSFITAGITNAGRDNETISLITDMETEMTQTVFFLSVHHLFSVCFVMNKTQSEVAALQL